MTRATLLLVTERTEFDAGAERISLAVAQRLHALVKAVCPLETNPEFIAVAPDLAARQEARLVRELAALAAQARTAGVTLTVEVRRGTPVQQIVGAARESAAELLVMRRLGKRGWLAHLTVGEVASRVAAQAPCPVLLVPRDAQPWTAHALAVLSPARPAPLQQLLPLLAAGASIDIICIGDATVPLALEQESRAAGIVLRVQSATEHWLQTLPALTRRREAQLVALPLAASDMAHGKLAPGYEAMLGALSCPALLVRVD